MSAHADLSHRVVFRHGEDASYAGPGLFIASTLPGIAEPAVSQSGDVVSILVLNGPGITNPQTEGIAIIAATAGGAKRLVMRLSLPAPGGGAGVVFSSFGHPCINRNGRVAFTAVLAGTGVTTANDNAIYIEQPGGPPALLFREGVQAPGLAAGINVATFIDVVNAPINDLGQVVVTASLGGAGITTANDTVLYRSDLSTPPSMIPLVREGDAADFIAPGVVFGGLTQGLIAADGAIVLSTALAGAGVTTSNDRAVILRRADGTLAVLMREGDPTPAGSGAPAGTYATPSGFALTPGGVLAFTAGITGATPSQSALWIGPHDGSAPFRAAAVLGSALVGAPAGQVLGGVFPTRIAAGDGGRAAFFTTITGTGVTTANDSAMFTEGADGPGMPRIIAREGSPAVGVAPAANHQPLNESLNAITINGRNQTAFIGRAANVGDGRDHGLWAVGETGQVQLVAFKGATVPFGPGDNKVVDVLGYRPAGGNPSAWRGWLNNQGELVYNIGFAGASGPESAILVATIDPPAACIADFNLDGNDTLQDLFDFLQAWFQQVPAADINGIDGVTVQDLFEFLVAWSTGCP